MRSSASICSRQWIQIMRKQTLFQNRIRNIFKFIHTVYYLHIKIRRQHSMSLEVDQIFNRIGISRTHIWIFVALCVVQILNSFQVVIISLISPYLKKSWDLGEKVEDIPLFFYSGIILGSLLAGSLANIVGRKNALLIGMVLQLVSNSFLVFSKEFDYFLIDLLILGIGIGVTLIAASTLCTELFPQKYRGRALLFLNFIAITGKLFAIFFMYFIESPDSWRYSQVYGFLSSFLITVVIALKVPESPRLLLAKGYLTQAYETFDFMLHQQKKEGLARTEKEQLKIWATYNEHHLQSKNMYVQIFKGEYLKVTIILCLNWFIINFVFYGQLFIMPFVFQRQTQGFTHFAEMICGEIPSIFITTNMIERERLGRKYSLVIFFLLATMLNFTSIYYNSIFLIATTRLTMKSIFQILYPLTAQSYSTPLRSAGLALCSGIGRIGSIVMPMLIFPLYQKQPYYVFVTFMGFCMLGLYSSLAAKETLHQNIDAGIFQQVSDESLAIKDEIEGIKVSNEEKRTKF